MITSHVYTGIEVPVFSEGTHVWSRDELRSLRSDATSPPPERFVRVVRLAPPDSMDTTPLEEILDRTDIELQHLAQLCGAITVNPRWGLYATDHPQRYQGNVIQAPHRALPIGFILAAKVDYIPEASVVSPQSKSAPQIDKGIEAYRGHPGEKLTDLRLHQFLEHPSGSGTEEVVLADIEPCWQTSPDLSLRILKPSAL